MPVSSVAGPDQVLLPLGVAVGGLAVVLALGLGLHPGGAAFLGAVLWVIAVSTPRWPTARSAARRSGWAAYL